MIKVQKTLVYLLHCGKHNGILCSGKKEWAPTLCSNSMDGTGKHFAMWNKPGGERKIPYDLTYTWNLINKTNKQAKYNQRHWNKDQTDSYQTGVGRGIIGEGPQRNMYKGHMDKAKAGRFKGGRHRWMGQGDVLG